MKNRLFGIFSAIRLKKKSSLSSRAYILLESLIALALLSVVTGILLSQMTASHRVISQYNREIEAANVGLMALDANQTELSANGVQVSLIRSPNSLQINLNGKKELSLEILEVNPSEN